MDRRRIDGLLRRARRRGYRRREYRRPQNDLDALTDAQLEQALVLAESVASGQVTAAEAEAIARGWDWVDSWVEGLCAMRG